MIFDSHAHYDDEKFDKDRKEILEEIFKEGAYNILNVSSDYQSIGKMLSLINEYDFIYGACGIHPHDVTEMTEETMNYIIETASKEKVVAIGEIGLDYYYDYSPRDLQKKWFARQINEAKNLKIPVVIHDRDAHEDTLKIVKSENAKEVGGVFHCYSGRVEMVKTVLNNNFYISVGGTVTFKNARKIIEVVEYVPIEKILVETDSPFLSPEPVRGRRNDSRNLRYIIQKISEIKKMSFEETASITDKNARTLFGI